MIRFLAVGRLKGMLFNVPSFMFWRANQQCQVSPDDRTCYQMLDLLFEQSPAFERVFFSLPVRERQGLLDKMRQTLDANVEKYRQQKAA